MRYFTLPLVLMAVVGLGACGTTTGERAGSGALMGAAGGALGYAYGHRFRQA